MDFLLLLLLNIATMAVLYLILRHRIRKEFNSTKFIDDMEREVGAIVTEMNQTTERNIQLIEHKLSSLREVSKHAEALLVRGREELDHQTTKLERYRNLGRKHSVVPATPAENSDSRGPIHQGQHHPQQRTTQGSGSSLPAEMVQEHSQVLKQSGPSTQRSKSDDSNPPGAQNPESREARKAQVLTLYHQGRDPQHIAETTGFTLGEIELIIALMRR